MKKRVFAFVLIFVLAMSVAVSAQALDKDSAGNGVSEAAAISGETLARDLYWMGQSLSLSNSSVGQSLICAGYDLTVSNTEIGGSVRAAGNMLNFQNTTVENNITAAGNVLSVDGGSRAAGVYMLGSSVTFNGACDTLGAAAGTVNLNGVVNGDVNISADKVVIGPEAVVTGVMTVQASEQPVIPATAQIANLQYKAAAVSEDDLESAAQVAAGAAFMHRVTSRVYWVFAVALLAALFVLLIPGSLQGAACMLKHRTLALLLTGLVTLLALPLLLVLLCVTFIGLPVAGLVALLSLTAMLFSVPFAGASASRLVFPKMNVWISSILGAAILSAARIIPFLGGLIAFAAIIYTLGYFVQVCYLRMVNRKPGPVCGSMGSAPVIPAPVLPGSVEVPQAPVQPAQPEQPKN
ncbi:MAG: hypothetical protein Q4E65_06490 [Clostridia bacterium]|nr:hypothetical protein [Clostridia bacterium]